MPTSRLLPVVALLAVLGALPLGAAALGPDVGWADASPGESTSATAPARPTRTTVPTADVDGAPAISRDDLIARLRVFPDRALVRPTAPPEAKPSTTAKPSSAPPPSRSTGCDPARDGIRLPGDGAVAAYLGDSYTTGWSGSGIGRRGWPAIVSRSYGWRLVNRAVAGTGFVNPGWTGQPVRTRLAAVIAARPGIVFLAAGHNDRRYASATTIRAADAVIARLRSALPNAALVVIGPIWQDGRPAASIVRLRNHLRARAAAANALFVDPLRGGWFAGTSHRFIKADGIHPDDAGHRFIAARVLAALHAAGVSSCR